MQFARPRFAPHPTAFGRGPVRVLAVAETSPAHSLNDDMRLFASTFAAGFLFVTIFLA